MSNVSFRGRPYLFTGFHLQQEDQVKKYGHQSLLQVRN